MATIVTRAGKGSPLTNTEVDTNFTNLNDGITTAAAITGGTINGTSIGASAASTAVFSVVTVDNLELDGNTIISKDTNGHVLITPNGTGGVGINGDPTGVVAGNTITSKFCVKHDGAGQTGGFVHANNSTAGSGAGIFACRSRGTIASPTVVQNNDALAVLSFAGHDGTDLALAAQIKIEVDGAPGNNDMPGRIVFSTTPDGSQSPAERVFIDSSGNVTINAQGDLRFADSDSSNWVAFQAPATIPTNITWTLPNADGTNGQALVTDGSGTLSWATATGGGGGGGTSVTVTQITATGGQTTFNVTYTVGQLSVYLNGALLASADYTATNGTTVVLAAGAAANDIFTAVAYSTVAGLTLQSASPFGTLVGSGAGAVNTGVNNVFVGFEAGNDNTGGTNCTAVGYQALDLNTTASHNTAIGSNSLGANTTGSENTAVGSSALAANQTGGANAAFGRSALASNTTGTDNCAFGLQALFNNTTANQNVGVGYQALFANTTGYNNTAVGYRALDANETGIANTAVGSNALGATTTGRGNSAFGGSATAYTQGALQDNTTGERNSAFGAGALGSNTTASNNTAIGFEALYANNTGAYNTAVGWKAADAVTTAQDITAVGRDAGGACTTGTDNTFLGANAGANITTGASNVFVGRNCSASAAGGTNQIVIGPNVTGQADTNVTIGNSTGKIYNAYTVNATWTQTSDERLKKNIQDDTLGLSFVNRLRPVKYQWKPSYEIDPSLPYYNEKNNRDTETVMHGLVAQEVKAALDAEGVTTFAGWDVGPDTIQAISREMFISPLIKAIQELSAKCDSLQAEINTLKGQ